MSELNSKGNVITVKGFTERKESAFDNPLEIQSNYEAARNLSLVISYWGWVIFTLCLITAFLDATMVAPINGWTPFVGFLLPLFAIGLAGLFLVGVGKFVMATVDSADYGREILGYMRTNSSAVMQENIQTSLR